MQAGTKELYSHPLIKKLMDSLRPVAIDASRRLNDAAKKGKLRSKAPYDLWEHERYDYDVFTHLTLIISGVEGLERSQNFIRRFPQPRSYEKQGINRHAWIEYHYSYYVVTLVSLFDIALILTNSVFRLGNRERDCKSDLIMTNNWVSRTPVERALADLAQLIRPHREGRNLLVHRGKLQDIASAMKSDELDLLKAISFVHMHAEPLIDKKIIDWAYKGHVKEICERLQEERDRVCDAIWHFFDAIFPTYDEKSTVLHAKWNERDRRMKQDK
jgi:hypothetical protein